MRTKKLGLLVAILILLVVPVAAVADGIITITSGAYSVVAEDVDFGSHALSLAAYEINTVLPAVPWYCEDTTGSDAGWSVSMKASDFLGGDPFPVTFAAGTLRIRIRQNSVECVAGPCTKTIPVAKADGGVASALDPTIALELIDQIATESEYGGWEFMPEFQLQVPAGLQPALYTSTWTLTMTAGP